MRKGAAEDAPYRLPISNHVRHDYLQAHIEQAWDDVTPAIYLTEVVRGALYSIHWKAHTPEVWKPVNLAQLSALIPTSWNLN